VDISPEIYINDTCVEDPIEMECFGASQMTYGGVSACSTIATFWSAAIADGSSPDGHCLSVARFHERMAFACKVWRNCNAGSQSAHEVIDMVPFFTAYKVESFALSTSQNTCGARPLLSSMLPNLLSDSRDSKGSFGAVVTAMGSSWALGFVKNEGWVVLDSHGPRAGLIRFNEITEVVNYVTRNCLGDMPCDVDVTIIWRSESPL